MPAAAPFLADRRILRATHGHAVVPAGNTDVATDALANVLFATLVDFSGQKRISNRGARCPDEVENPSADLRHHRIGRCEAAHSYHGPRRQALDEIDDRLVTALRGKARRRTIRRTRVHFHIPQIRNFGEQFDDFVRFRARTLALTGTKLLKTDSQRHRARVADRIAGHLKEFAHQPHPIGNAAPIRIRAPIPFGQQELVRQVAHAGVHIDDVEAGPARAQRRRPMPAAKGADVGLGHGSCLGGREVCRGRDAARRQHAALA